MSAELLTLIVAGGGFAVSGLLAWGRNEIILKDIKASDEEQWKKINQIISDQHNSEVVHSEIRLDIEKRISSINVNMVKLESKIDIVVAGISDLKTVMNCPMNKDVNKK